MVKERILIKYFAEDKCQKKTGGQPALLRAEDTAPVYNRCRDFYKQIRHWTGQAALFIFGQPRTCYVYFIHL